MHSRNVQLGVLALVALAACGCSLPKFGNRELAGPAALIDNPLFVPALDREFLWNQTVDAIDDNFRIEREERVRLIGGILTEGRIDTFPVVGSTLLEPWRTDSTPGYEKWHATLQSIRRKATVRVIPGEGGYLIDVAVQKELEDLDKPENATAGGATQRHDGTLVRQTGPPGRFSVTLGWIPLGRDVSLEQQILADLQRRLVENCAPPQRLGGDLPIEPEDLAADEPAPGAAATPETLPSTMQRVP